MKDKFSDAEWESITETPLLVFQAVAAADGKIDKKEKKAFQSALQSHKINSELASEVLNDAKSRYSDIDSIPDYSMSTIALKLQGMHDITKSKTDIETAVHFKKVMLALGLYVGNSSGGFFGSNLSDEEVDALKKVGSYMNLSVSQLNESPTVQDIVNQLG